MHKSTPLDDLYQQYLGMIAKMPLEFTSHEFILKLSQQYQPEYIAALGAYCDGREPFREVHRQVSAKLGKYPDLIEHAGTAKSHDIFGKANTCSGWRKLK